MKVALIQMDIVWEDREANLSLATEMIAKAASDGAQVAVLPEMCTTGFSMSPANITEEPGGESSRAFASLAHEYDIHIIAGIAQRDPSTQRGRNTAQIFGPDGEIVASYIKARSFAFAGEDKHYDAGEKQVIFDAAGVSSSVFICYDLRFPELFREVCKSVKIMYVIANWPASRATHWRALLQARAIENQAYVIGVNRTGADGNNILYKGRSICFDPLGECLMEAPEAQGVYMVDIDPLMVEKIRSEFPFLRDLK